VGGHVRVAELPPVGTVVVDAAVARASSQRAPTDAADQQTAQQIEVAFIVASGKPLVHRQSLLGPLPNVVRHQGGDCNLNPLLAGSWLVAGPAQDATTGLLRPPYRFMTGARSIVIGATGVGGLLEDRLNSTVMPTFAPGWHLVSGGVQPIDDLRDGQLALSIPPIDGTGNFGLDWVHHPAPAVGLTHRNVSVAIRRIGADQFPLSHQVQLTSP
jgi:hypothetical protein